jgi:sarcosine oxidase / L-pipecolate oxidase
MTWHDANASARDSITPNQDWIISPHPRCKNLYIATGGSFHAWKFLPIIGKYVVQMIQGRLDEEIAGRWAWDRGRDGAANAVYIPMRDLKDIVGYSDLEG